MQIFVTSKDPSECANRLWQVPQRARGMITETMQIIAHAQNHLFGTEDILRKDGTPYILQKSRMNHPVVKWARENLINYRWTCWYMMCLFKGYKGKGYRSILKNIDENIPVEVWGLPCPTPQRFCNFAKADSKELNFTHVECTFEAYDQFLKAQGA
jgi:hypothetical protein